MVCEYLSKTLLLILLGVYPEEGSVDRTVTLFPSRGTPTLFPMVAAPLYIPTHRAQEFRLLRILANTCYLLFW